MTTPQRSYNMSRIRGRDTKPEMIVRRYLWAHGFRYRLNHKRLPGKPDIVLRKYRTCIFVNGCFWHGHRSPLLTSPSGGTELQSSECCKIPKTNREFWVRKIVRNKERDIEVQKELAKMGWHCVTVWECELSTKPVIERRGRKDTKFFLSEKETVIEHRDTESQRGVSSVDGATTMRERTLERLAYTLNEIYLKDHSVHHQTEYSMPEDDTYAMAAEELHNDKH